MSSHQGLLCGRRVVVLPAAVVVLALVVVVGLEPRHRFQGWCRPLRLGRHHQQHAVLPLTWRSCSGVCSRT